MSHARPRHAHREACRGRNRCPPEDSERAAGFLCSSYLQTLCSWTVFRHRTFGKPGEVLPQRCGHLVAGWSSCLPQLRICNRHCLVTPRLALAICAARAFHIVVMFHILNTACAMSPYRRPCRHFQPRLRQSRLSKHRPSETATRGNYFSAESEKRASANSSMRMLRSPDAGRPALP